MLELILVRHGETAWNKNEVYRGRADVALNKTGLKQADLAGKYLSAEKIDVIYSSPLQRALQTAAAIARFQQTPVNAVANLIDFDYGEWQGLTSAEVKQKYPELYQDWLDTPEQVRIPGGESLQNVLDRALPFVQDAVTRCREGKMALVSHRVVLKVIICALLCLDNAQFWNIKLDNGAITRFTFDGKRVVLTSHNETSHLKSISSQPLNDF
jgi:broad specificity phosphatase PhoE